MPQTYMEFIYEALIGIAVGAPIYTSHIAKAMAGTYNLQLKDAAAATAVTIKRILDGNAIPELRCYQKGIYYRTGITVFGETGINEEQLIADKYLSPDIGYLTDFTVLHYMGLTSQMPRERVLATNKAKGCRRIDKRLGVIIRPPKVMVTVENKWYLRTLDVLDLLERAPVDADHPYVLINNYIREQKLEYKTLLAIADKHYNKNTVLQLAHTANLGGIPL